MLLSAGGHLLCINQCARCEQEGDALARTRRVRLRFGRPHSQTQESAMGHIMSDLRGKRNLLKAERRTAQAVGGA